MSKDEDEYVPKPAGDHDPGAEAGHAQELTRLHLEVLVRMVCNRIWDADGPDLAEISELLPDDPYEITYGEILAVLEKIGVQPRDYFWELSRESTRRRVEEEYLRLLAAWSRSFEAESCSGRPPPPVVLRSQAHGSFVGQAPPADSTRLKAGGRHSLPYKKRHSRHQHWRARCLVERLN